MKLFKKAVSVFLAILMIFGSVSLIATAADATYNLEIDTKFYRYDGSEWVETTKAARGESIRARVFLTTDFALGASNFFFFYPSDVLTQDPTEYEEGNGDDRYYLIMNTDPDSKVYDFGLEGEFAFGEAVEDLLAVQMDEGYITEADIEGKSGLFINLTTSAGGPIILDGSEWFFEFHFTVNEDAPEGGQFYLATELIADYENYMASTVIAAQPKGETGRARDFASRVEAASDVDTGTFGYTLNDRDADSTLSFDNTVIFTAGEKVAEYTGYINEPLSSIAGFSIPTASADGQQFLGWSLDGSTVMSDDEVKAVKVGYETVELKAVFQAAAASYTQNVYTMDVNGNYGAAVEASIGSAPGTVVNAASYSVPAGFTLDVTRSSGDKTVEADGSTVVDIYLERNKYNATFGTASTPVYYEATYTAPAGADTDTGIFEYWVNAADESVILKAGDTAVMGLADVTYTAKYKAVYDVTYTFAGTVPSGVEAPAATTTTEGAIIAKPAVEVPAGYNLVWTANGATANEDGTFTAGAGNVTITGTWSKIPYTVTYVYADNGNIPAGYTAPAATTLTIGETITAPAVEIPAGYKLDWELEGDVMGAADVTMTGTWSKIPYTVTYKFSGEAPVSAPAAETATIGDAVELPEMEAAGWTFNGWTVTGANGADGNYTVGTSDVTVTGSWTKNVYVVNFWFDFDMTELYDSQEYYFGDEVIYPGDPTDDMLPEPGTYFDGWDQDVIEVIDADTADTYFTEEEPGRWVYNNSAYTIAYEYTVSIKFRYRNSEGNVINTVDKTPVPHIPYYYGDVITADDLPATAEEGYEFTGWSVAIPYTVTKSVTIFAEFKAETYNAIFDANGGAWLNGDTERTFAVDYGTDIVAPFEDPVFEGYHLDPDMKWDPELGTMFDEDQTFYANWIPNEYVLTFVVEDTSYVSEPQEFGGKIAVPAEVVTENVKPGYEFKGWTADGGATVIADITTVDVPAADTTYTAVFAPSAGGVDYTINRYFMNTSGNYDGVEPEVITGHDVAEKEITYSAEVAGFTLDKSLGNLTIIVAGDGSSVINAYYARNKVTVNVNGTEGEYFQGEKVDIPDAPKKEGETFDHWEDENGNTVTDPYVVPNEEDKEVTLTPVYTKNEYTATFIISAEGTSVTYTTTKAKYTDPVVAPADPTAEVPAGYTFKGWAKTEGATEALTDLGNMPVNGITFYAVLASGTDVEYTIEKYFMGLDKTYAIDETKTVVGTDGTAGAEKTLTLDADEFEGFTLNTAHADSVLTAVVKGNGTTVFKAYYDRDTVKVTINGNETEKYYGEEITEDDMPAHPAAPEGMEPDGWVDGNDKPVKFPVKVGTEDIVIVPDYKASEFVITFMNGDAVAQTGKQTYGETLAVPAAPSLTGHTFDGWYAGDVKVVAGTTKVPAAATTYTAKFTPNNYTVTFTTPDGATVATGEYAFGTKISTILPEYTAPAGYAFGGWSLDGSTKVEFTDDVTVPVDGITYVAIHTAGASNYTVETYVMNVSGVGYAKSTEIKTDVTGTVINYTPEDKTGFTLDTESSVLTDTVTGDGQMKIKVFYTRNQYTVTVDGVLGANVYYQGTYTTPATSSSTAAGYTLTGWTDGTNTYGLEKEIVVTDALNLTAINTPNKYTVTFKVRGATFAAGEYDFGTAIVDPGVPTLAGYTFGGWTKNGTPVDLATETVPANNVTYTAVMTANSNTAYTVYKVFQNTDGHTWGEPVEDVRYGTTGAAIEIDENAEVVEGFSISEIDYVNDTIAADGSAEVYIYYARNLVNITINGDKDEYFYGEEIEAPAAPSKDGYTFTGWEDADGNTVTFPIEATKDVVINPVFEANTVSLSFVVDGVALEGYPTDAVVDSVITAPTAPKKDGYNFVDWYIQGTNVAFNGKMPTADTVYEARYTAGANTKFAIEIYTMNTKGVYEKTVTHSIGVTDTTAWIEPSTDLPGLTPNLEKSITSDVIKANGSTVLKIYYDRDLYEVTWNVDGAETTTEVYYGAEIVAPADPAKDGYTFAGWTPDVPATLTEEKDLEFKATWEAAAYTVTYVVNGEKTTESYAFGATVTVKAAPKVEGMIFNGWFDNGVEYAAGSTFTMPANDLIIVADFSIGVYKVTFVDATGAVFATEMVKFGDEIPVPDAEPTKDNYVFKGWNMIYDTMPEMNITIEPIFERIPVKLIAKAGSKTIIDRDINVITGLREYLTKESDLDAFLDVEGDGFFTVTPVAAKQYGTGTKIELYDNADPTVVMETYVIVIYGDINGDSAVTPVDSTFADDEGLMITDWSEETVYDAATGTMVANPNYDPYKVMAADLNADGIIDAIDATIIGDASIGIYRIDQVTGKAS